jgi:hypothetical protein
MQNHHQINTIKEILETLDENSNPAFRVLGIFSNYDIHHNLAILSQPGSKDPSSFLFIDTSLLHKFAPKESSIYELFGEVEVFDGKLPIGFESFGASKKILIMRARMKRNVDGVDIELYEQVEMLRRKFEIEQKSK